MYQREIGKPLGLATNTRGGICPAGRERTFGGMPVGQAASEGTQKIPHTQGNAGFFF